MEYPAILKEMMQAGAMKQAHLARRLKVTQPTVSRWLRGARPELDQHQRILVEARKLGVLKGAADESPTLPASAPPITRVVGYVGRPHRISRDVGQPFDGES